MAAPSTDAARSRLSGRIASLKARCNGGSVSEVYVGDAVLAHAAIDSRGTRAVPFSLRDLAAVRPNAVYIINNNDVINLRSYVELYLSSPQTIFIVWDWDNHHQLRQSMPLAAFSDLYVPAHLDFYGQLSQISDTVVPPVWAATHQWSREFLVDHSELIRNVARSELPLGRHGPYPQFPRRLEALTRLNTFFPEVGPSVKGYHQSGELERLKQWCSHAAHWILPVRNDVPIRLFDALITGGVPIVPRTLEQHPALAAFADHIVFYGPSDIENPLPITSVANAKFRDGGLEGIKRRFDLAFHHSHIDSSLTSILERLANTYGVDRSG
jgi:hypothetical protein